MSTKYLIMLLLYRDMTKETMSVMYIKKEIPTVEWCKRQFKYDAFGRYFRVIKMVVMGEIKPIPNAVVKIDDETVDKIVSERCLMMSQITSHKNKEVKMYDRSEAGDILVVYADGASKTITCSLCPHLDLDVSPNCSCPPHKLLATCPAYTTTIDYEGKEVEDENADDEEDEEDNLDPEPCLNCKGGSCEYCDYYKQQCAISERKASRLTDEEEDSLHGLDSDLEVEPNQDYQSH